MMGGICDKLARIESHLEGFAPTKYPERVARGTGTLQVAMKDIN